MLIELNYRFTSCARTSVCTVGVNTCMLTYGSNLCSSLRIGGYTDTNTLMVSCFLGMRFDSWLGSPVAWVTHTLPLGLQWSSANEVQWKLTKPRSSKVQSSGGFLCTHTCSTHSLYHLVRRATGQLCFKVRESRSCSSCLE